MIQYVAEQLNDQLQGVAFLPHKEGDPTYFGIPPKFISTSLNGTFQNTIIIAMGCNGLTYSDMAKAFVNTGAKAYVGWNDSVTASHTDGAIQRLLEYLIIERKTIGDVVPLIPPDPSDNAILTYHPSAGAQNFVIPQKSLANNLLTQQNEISTTDQTLIFKEPESAKKRLSIFGS